MAKLQAYSLIFLMLFVASIPLHGQYSFEDTIPIDEVLIKAKIANNQHAAGFVTQRIDTLEMMQKITGSLSELLAESTPVFIKSQVRGASATASMRGAGASHTKVLWNNVPINSPLTGQVDFSLLPVYFTDELELFYGSASLQNSNGALGGSVAINNTPDWSKGVSANVMKQIGQFGTYGTFAQANIGNGTINFRNRFFVEQTENNYPYYFKANRTGEISGYRKLENANYTKWGNLSELNLRVNAKSIAGAKFWVQKSKRNIPALINSSALNHDENQQDYNLKILTFYKHYGTRFSWEIQSAFILDELNYYLINQVNEQVASDSHFDASNQYKSNISSFIGTYTTTNHWRISVQFETKFDWVYVENKKTIQGYKENQDAVSGMFALHKNFGERWFFSALLRQQWINSEWINPIPSIGAEYLLSKRLETKLKANVARNYHAPSLNDLYYLPGGNASLMPEQGTTFDVSVSQNTTNGAWQFSHALNGYYSVIKNWIQWTPSQFEYWMPVNKSEVHARY